MISDSQNFATFYNLRANSNNPDISSIFCSAIRIFQKIRLGVYISYHNHIVDLKRQNRLKVGTDKPKLKVKMQSVSDDDVRKRLLEKPAAF